MYKKVILLILSFVFLTGCEAVYNLDVGDNIIKDELIINNYDKSTWVTDYFDYKDAVNKAYENLALPIDKDTPGFTEIPKGLPGYEYYKKELINTDNNYGLKLYYTFDDKKYLRSSLYPFFTNSTLTINSYSFVFDSGTDSTYDLFKFQKNLDKLTINVKTNYKVVNNNADSVNNNIYTWVLTRDNYKSKNIHIEIDKSVKLVNKEDSDRSDLITNIILIGVGIVLFASIIVTIIKVKKSNK